MVAIAVTCLITCVFCVASCVIMDKNNNKILKEWKETLDLCNSIIDHAKRVIARNNELVEVLKDKGLLEEETE